MKYIAIIVVSAFAGFVGAWLLFKSTASAPVVPANIDRARPAAQSPWTGADAPIVDNSKAPGFADIDTAATIFDQLYTAWRLAAAAQTTDALEALLDQTLQKRDPLYRHNIAAILLERYVELDPLRAMNYVDSEFRLDQINMKGHVLTSWVRYDPEGALNYLRGITDQRVRITAGARLLEDPTLAALGLQDEVADIVGDQRASQILERAEMRQTDPAALFQAASMMTGSDRRDRMQFAVTRWVEQDPEAALTSIAELSDEGERRRLLQIAISTYSQQDPEAALDYLRLNYPTDKEMFVYPIAMIANRDIQSALRLAEDYQRQFDDDAALGHVIRTWSSQSPAEALQYVATLTTDERRALYPSIASNYLQQDPGAAMRWLISLGDEYADIKRSSLHVRSVESFRAGEQLLPTVTDDGTRQQLIASMANFQANQDPEAALTWLQTYNDEPAFARALPGVLGHLARTDPRAAARFIDTNRDQPNVTNSTTAVAQAWYRRSPAEATRWLGSLPDSDTKHQAISHMSTVVARRNGLDDAASLLALLPTGQVRDNASRQVAFSWAGDSTERTEEVIDRLNLDEAMAEQLRARLANR